MRGLEHREFSPPASTSLRESTLRCQSVLFLYTYRDTDGKHWECVPFTASPGTPRGVEVVVRIDVNSDFGIRY